MSKDIATQQRPAEDAVPLPKSKVRRPFSATLGTLLVLFWLLVAIFGNVLAPYDPSAMVSPDIFASYSTAHWLGTDFLGRDMLSRVLDGARYSVGLALISTILACLTGVSLALLAVLSNVWVDEAISRVMDALISMPSKMLALVLVSVFGSSVPLLIIMAVLAYSPGCFRISRSLALNIAQMEYVLVARSRGESRFYIAAVEMLPNMTGPILADFGMRFVFSVLLLSGMSFLGLGVQLPAADLGSLVRENIAGLSQGVPAVLWPALSLGTLTIGVNLLIDSLSARRRGGF